MNCHESVAIINIYKIVKCVYVDSYSGVFFLSNSQRILLPQIIKNYYTIKNLYLIVSGLWLFYTIYHLDFLTGGKGNWRCKYLIILKIINSFYVNTILKLFKH